MARAFKMEPKVRDSKVEGMDVSIRHLKPSEMNVDLSYQRDPNKRRGKINSIVAKYDRNMLGAFHACVRPDRSVWLLDGAGRKMAMAMVGDDDPVVTFIHNYVKCLEQEADAFLRLNPDEVARVNPSQKFKASLTANDPVAKEINNNALKGGLVVGGQGANGISIQAAKCLSGLGVLTRVGFIKRAAWETSKPTGIVYVALAGSIVACPDLNEDRLRKILKENPPSVIFGATKAEYGADAVSHARETAPRMARIIVQMYNHHASAHRVTPNWTRANQLMEPFYDQWRAM